MNVYGKPLQPCSQPGMSMTGFTRTGKCEHHQQDAGSHHVCIDLTSAKQGNFCTVTGQPDWCSNDMACHDNPSQQCPTKHWCVCEWAFASYLDRAGGCDHIGNVVCDATHQKTLEHYEKDTRPHIQRALQCLKQKCSL